MSIVVATFAVAGGAGGAASATPISVSFAPATSQGDGCASADSMSMTKKSTTDSYSFVITVATDLCSPVKASALAYAMPNNRTWPWPQMLIQQKDVTFSEAGVTTITFAKDCDPIQFDLVTGAAPQVVDPFKPETHHGPLLFPHTNEVFANGSAYQYWPRFDRCEEATSSTSSTPTSSTNPTESVPVTVEPATTLPTDGPGGDVNPDAEGGQPGATVEAVQVTQSPTALSVAG